MSSFYLDVSENNEISEIFTIEYLKGSKSQVIKHVVPEMIIRQFMDCQTVKTKNENGEMNEDEENKSDEDIVHMQNRGLVSSIEAPMINKAVDVTECSIRQDRDSDDDDEDQDHMYA